MGKLNMKNPEHSCRGGSCQSQPVRIRLSILSTTKQRLYQLGQSALTIRLIGASDEVISAGCAMHQNVTPS